MTKKRLASIHLYENGHKHLSVKLDIHEPGVTDELLLHIFELGAECMAARIDLGVPFVAKTEKPGGDIH